MNQFCVGLDLGKAQDYTAMAIVETLEHSTVGAPGAGRPLPLCHLRHLQRFPLGTPYTELAVHMKALMDRPPLRVVDPLDGIRSRATLIVDATGVGAPVVELLNRQGLRPIEILIHGGAAVRRAGVRQYHLPKRDLIMGLQVAFQERRLLVADGLPEGPIFVQELMNIDYNFTPAGNDVYVHREGAHDDLVLAVALAHWYAAGRIRLRSGAPVVVMGRGI
ncbi:MAG: hypothetical protein ACYDBB_17700 [Armatimonadota bacterium]